MLPLLASMGFEEYQEIAAHPVVKSNLVNPFDPKLLGSEGNFFFPFSADMVVPAVWLILAAVLLLWCSLRVNYSYVYKILSLGFGLLGLDALLGMQTPFPSLFTMLAAGVSMLIIFLGFTIFFSVIAIRHLPYFGVPERFITDAKDGDVTKGTMVGVAVFTTAVFMLVLLPFQDFILGAYNYHAYFYLITAALAAAFGFFAGRDLIPWTILEDHPLLGGGYLKEVTNIFVLEGEASGAEMAAAGSTICILFVCSVRLIKGSLSAADIFGVLCIMVLCLIMGRALVNKAKGENIDPEDILVKKKSGW